MNREIKVNTTQLHLLIESIAKRSYEEGYKQAKAKKPAEPARVNVSMVNILRLDQSMKQPKRGIRR